MTKNHLAQDSSSVQAEKPNRRPAQACQRMLSPAWEAAVSHRSSFFLKGPENPHPPYPQFQLI